MSVPTILQQESLEAVQGAADPSRQSSGRAKTRVNYVNIEFSNGLKMYHKSLDYDYLKLLVEKLEVLCWQ